MFGTAVLKSVYFGLTGKRSSVLRFLGLIEIAAFMVFAIQYSGGLDGSRLATPMGYDYQIEKNISLLSAGF